MSTLAQRVAVTGAFDDVRSAQIRFLQEAARLGEVTVLLWTDEAIHRRTGRPPKFPQAERLYLLRAIRYVGRAALVEWAQPENALPELPGFRPDLWAVTEAENNAAVPAFCAARGIRHRVFRQQEFQGFPDDVPDSPAETGRPKVIVTGCFDWFHSGHVRFFEEVSTCGDLYVVVGHDANIRLLKGGGHPLFPEAERRFMVQSVRFVRQALISTGEGWLDAEPEIARLKPDIYAVNEDGDQPVKREYCTRHGIKYLVLRRVPAAGLPARRSTDLRGF